MDPMQYVRKDAPGTDGWNRVIATYGQCESQNSALPYVVVLAILNIGVLLVANYQAYRARKIASEFSESQYIGISMAFLLQAAAVGAPVLLLVRDDPLAWYLTSCFMIFFVSFGILCLMFIPKIQAALKPAEASSAWNGTSQFAQPSTPLGSVQQSRQSMSASNRTPVLPHPSIMEVFEESQKETDHSQLQKVSSVDEGKQEKSPQS